MNNCYYMNGNYLKDGRSHNKKYFNYNLIHSIINNYTLNN